MPMDALRIQEPDQRIHGLGLDTSRGVLRGPEGRDGAGSVIRQDKILNNGAESSWTYQYDNLGHLQTAAQVDPAVASPLQATTWGYDGISENGSDIAQYDNQDRLLIWKNNSYSYNLAGDLQSASTPSGTTNDQYNALGNLTQVQCPPAAPSPMRWPR